MVDVIGDLVHDLRTGSADTQRNAARALWIMADINDKTRVAADGSLAIGPLVELLRIGNASAGEYAARALLQLARQQNERHLGTGRLPFGGVAAHQQRGRQRAGGGGTPELDDQE